jgi:hypothetical protein
MAVELRCPDCRAKLRLQVAPEPDSEIECSKCGSVFATDDNIVHAGEDEDAAVKKKPVARENGEKGKKKPDETKAEAKKDDKPKAAEKPQKRKKRRGKKKKTNPAFLYGIIGGALMFLGLVIGVVVWYMGRKSAAQEMMSYLPDDCDEVVGLNLGHMQKYPEFYKSAETAFKGRGLYKAGEEFSKGLGKELTDTVEYVIQGEGAVGGKPDGQPVEATVLRTKFEYDTSLLSKLPGAKEYTASGVKYYTINDIPQLPYPQPRVFAPTNRLVVFCRGDVPDAKFKSMLTANRDNIDATIVKRAGPLIKLVTRGTAWRFTVYGRSIAKFAAPPPPPDRQLGEEDELKKEIAELLGPAKGTGIKASVGSREIRGEWLIWYKDSDTPGTTMKKWTEKDWVKDDEKDPPRWWRSLAMKTGGGKTAPNALRDRFALRTSGEVFIVRSAMDTKLIQPGTVLGAFNPPGSNSGMPGTGGPGAPGPTPGGPPMPGGPGPGATPPAPGMRRRFAARTRRGAAQASREPSRNSRSRA